RDRAKARNPNDRENAGANLRRDREEEQQLRPGKSVYPPGLEQQDYFVWRDALYRASGGTAAETESRLPQPFSDFRRPSPRASEPIRVPQSNRHLQPAGIHLRRQDCP